MNTVKYSNLLCIKFKTSILLPEVVKFGISCDVYYIQGNPKIKAAAYSTAY